MVTGARRGIGLAMAEALAGAGADIVAVSAQLEDSGSEVEQRVTKLGRECLCLSADFADRGQIMRLAAQLADLDRPIDILVNNASTIARPGRRAPRRRLGPRRGSRPEQPVRPQP
ncbi:MAG TPA: SDR family NAD(P)-dependent oxidoreductase [Actinocrinis sp.]|nr:SDR family NAD(P)-dependent oxidoreductase [Actinocrinis sp.]HEV2345797.1 SDR family NAD(P)-dependent oxidoreductase [Actinocrinis sp.]